MALAPVWRVAPAADAGPGAAVMGWRHVLLSGGAVMDRRKGRFAAQTVPLFPVGKQHVHTAVKSGYLSYLRAG